jgi:hypothetical protein
MVLGSLLAAAATSACVLVHTRWGLLPLRALQGIGEAAVFVGAATSISDLAPPGRGAEAASYFSVAVFGGLGIGPVISESVIGRDRFDAGLLTAAAFAALAAVLATLTPAGIRHHHHDAEPGPRFHRAAIPSGLVLALGVGGFVTFTAFMPEYSRSVGLSGSKWVFATYAAVCLLIRIVAATVPDRIGHARAVTIALTFMLRHPHRVAWAVLHEPYWSPAFLADPAAAQVASVDILSNTLHDNPTGILTAGARGHIKYDVVVGLGVGHVIDRHKRVVGRIVDRGVRLVRKVRARKPLQQDGRVRQRDAHLRRRRGLGHRDRRGRRLRDDDRRREGPGGDGGASALRGAAYRRRRHGDCAARTE